MKKKIFIIQIVIIISLMFTAALGLAQDYDQCPYDCQYMEDSLKTLTNRLYRNPTDGDLRITTGIYMEDAKRIAQDARCYNSRQGMKNAVHNAQLSLDYSDSQMKLWGDLVKSVTDFQIEAIENLF